MRKNDIMLRMTAREIKKNWLQYLSMIIINMLAVTLFCGFISNTKTLEKTINDYYQETDMFDLNVQVTAFDSEDKSFFESLGIEFEYRLYLEGSLNQKSAKVYIGNNRISRPLVVEGNKGVLIDRKTFANNGYSIGDRIVLETTGLPDLELMITGSMNFVEVANTFSYAPVYIEADRLAGLLPVSLDHLYNQVIIKTDKADEVKENINSYFAGKQDSNLIFIYEHANLETVVMLNGEITQSLKMIYVFPVIFLIVSILVIMATISPLIIRERTNIGTLKALGISNIRLLLHYASFGAILCLIGGIIGAILGPMIVPNVLLIKYNLVYCLPKTASIIFDLPWSLLAVGSTSVLALIIGYAIGRAAIKEKPAQCMRPIPPRKNMIIEKFSSKETRKGNIALKMSLRNIIIKPTRSLMTIIGVAGCSALLVCSFGIGDTVSNSIVLELDRQFSYDISTRYVGDDFVLKMDELIADGRIASYETYEIYYFSARGKNVKDIKVYDLPIDSGFTSINPKNKNILSKSIAEELKIKEKDELVLTCNSFSVTITIDEIVETSITKGLFVSDFRIPDIYHSRQMWIKAVASDELIDFINEHNGTQNAFSKVQMREQVNNSISSINMIRYTLMFFAIALSIVVLYNLSLLNVKEKHREIATMKVLGFSNREIGSSLLLEIMLLVVLGTIIGLVLGYPITHLVMYINKIEVLSFIYHINPISYLLSCLLSIATALLINLIFSRQIGKINMIESLKSIE